MHFCSSCNNQLKEKDLFCSRCGTPRTSYQAELSCPYCNSSLDIEDLFCSRCGNLVQKVGSEIDNGDTILEEYTLKPRFVFVYELLPSSFQTVIILVMLFIVCNMVSQYYHYDTKWILILFIILFAVKEFKIFFRKFKYRNIKYVITNSQIEYHNLSKNEQLVLSYKDLTDVRIQKNLATYLFGYGHILVLSGRRGIYLDYIADVEKVYNYILDHMKH